MLRSIGLVRQGRRGFCPACRLLLKADDTAKELSIPVVTALAILAVAGVAWAAVVAQSGSMAAVEMAPGLEPIEIFATTWVVMMAALMLPSAIPVILEFARAVEGRIRWQLAIGVLVVTYISVWLAFGMACYVTYMAVGMPWPNQALVAGLTLAFAGVYSVSPIKRASQARCRELCALHAALPFGLLRSAAVVGVRYGLSCVGCSAGLMVAMVMIGMSSLLWALILGVVVLIYKYAPALPLRYELALSVGLAALGVIYVVSA